MVSILHSKVDYISGVMVSILHSKVDYISGVMVSILSSSELHRDQAKDYKIGSCCFPPSKIEIDHLM
jgi:hypothetical protein